MSLNTNYGNANYGNYKHPTDGQNLVDNKLKTNNNSEKATGVKLDEKTSTISQQIFAKAQENNKAGDELGSHYAEMQTASTKNMPIPKAIANSQTSQRSVSNHENGTADKHENGISPHLLQADQHRMNAINGNGQKEDNKSKFDKMEMEDILKAIDIATQQEVPLIMARIKELKAIASQEINEISNNISTKDETITSETKIHTKEVHKLDKIERKLGDVKYARILEADGKTLRMLTIKDLNNLDRLVHFNPETGTLHVPESLASSLAVGQRLRYQNENGSYTRHNLNELENLSHEEHEGLTESTIVLINNQNQGSTQEEKKADKGTQSTTISSPRDQQTSSTDKNSQATNVQQKQEKMAASAELFLASGKNLKEANEKRLADLAEFLDLKEALIKQDIKKHEINNQDMQSTELARSNKQQSVDLRELHTENMKVDLQLKQFLKQAGEVAEIEIPLATLVRFQKLEVTFDEVTKMVADEAKTDRTENLNENKMNAVIDTVTIKKEIMKELHEFLSTQGVIKGKAHGNAGRGSAT